MYKHLSVEQRVIIEDRLNHKQSIRNISKEINVSPSTVLRETSRNAVTEKALFNNCKFYKTCKRRSLCKEPYCNRLCSHCGSINCTVYCTEYEPNICPKKELPNSLCNGCSSFNICKNEKRYYKAIFADDKYHKGLKECREGFDLTAEEFQTVDRLASPMIKNGTSPYHIKQTYGEELPVSESTLRRMIDRCELDARNIDLHDKVKRNPRKSTNNSSRKNYLITSKIGRFYSDYLKYVEEHDIHTTEMDCVEGIKGENEVLLTLTIKELSLQMAFIMESQDCENVIKTLDKIEEALGTDLFKEVFPIILTDNGSEFADIYGIEKSINGGQRTKVFFCEPNRSDEKGTCENHHKMIRYCIPKGTSLKPFNQSQITMMMNHINSYKRKALFGKSAFEIARAVLPEDFFILLGQEDIEPTAIILSPKLFLHSKCNG